MNNEQHNLKHASVVALCAMGILFIGAIVFFKERLFADTSYLVFNIINFEQPSIPHQRYGGIVTQLFPWLGAVMHLPVTTLLVGYIVGFNLFFLIIGLVLFFGIRQYKLVTLLGLYYVLIVSDSYFLANAEIHLVVATMFLMFGTAFHYGNKQAGIIRLIIPFSLLALFTLITHFIVIIPTTFLWIYFILDKQNWPFKKNTTILLSLILMASVAVKFAITGSSQQYENGHLHHLSHFSLQDLIDTFTSPVVRMFCYRCISNYWIAVLVFSAGIYALLKDRQKPLLIWTLVSFTGYFIMMGLTYRDFDEFVKLFHIETEWQSIGIIMATPFVSSFLPKIRPRIAAGLLLVVFLTRFAYIGHSGQAFTWRLHYTERILARMKKKDITKLALYHDKALADKYILDWALPYESLLLSAMNGDRPQRTFMFVHADQAGTIEAISHPSAVFLFGIFRTNDINAHYFYPDTTRPYQLMTTEQFFK